eukprot:COSAG06_NODE_17578_length_933_cov_0.747002_1_plen_32_part_10
MVLSRVDGKPKEIKEFFNDTATTEIYTLDGPW